MIIEKNSQGRKFMGYKCDTLKVCCKSHQLLYLPKNSMALQHTSMWKCPKKPQGLGVHITMRQLMELSEKMKHLTSTYPGPKLNKPVDHVKLCAILQDLVP